MVYGVGTDLCSVERVLRAAESENFLSRVFTEDELRDSAGHPEHLAACFAAKEACVKAFRTGFSGGLAPQDVELLHGEKGAPVLRFHGKAAELFAELGLGAAHVSLSHEAGLAIAFVVLES